MRRNTALATERTARSSRAGPAGGISHLTLIGVSCFPPRVGGEASQLRPRPRSTHHELPDTPSPAREANLFALYLKDIGTIDGSTAPRGWSSAGGSRRAGQCCAGRVTSHGRAAHSAAGARAVARTHTDFGAAATA